MTRITAHVEHHPSLESTNIEAKRRALEGAPEGTVIVADQQSAGRGQRGRSWHSPQGAGLYCSFILRPHLPVERCPCLTLVAGLAVFDTLTAHGADVALKWPNDVLVASGPMKGRKLAGILTEGSIAEGRLQFAIVGIGINLKESERPAELNDTVASLELLGLRQPPEPLLETLTQSLGARLHRYETQGTDWVPDAWWRRTYAPGSPVLVEYEDRAPVAGLLDGLEADGRLRLRTPTGPICIADGRVRFVRADAL
jgi:BirA family transcriptional regulator, biotin operon repressor / biotin---[acetyl-CoA-carboxylase] ligase